MEELLTPLQQDALCEIINIGVGRSALVMSDLTGTEILLSVPTVSLCTRSRLNGQDLGRWHRVGAVVQEFEGSFCGKALFLFPDNDGAELARLMMTGIPSAADEVGQGDDSLRTAGSVLLESCLAAFSEAMEGELVCFRPVYETGSALDVLTQGQDERDAIMLVHIEFAVEAERIDGSFCFLVEASSAGNLVRGIEHFIASPRRAAGR